MKLLHLLTLALLFLIACGGSNSDDDDDNNNDAVNNDTPPIFEMVEISDLSASVTDGYAMVFDKQSMTVEYVELTPGQVPSRPQTMRDEVFYIFEGTGTITIGTTEQAVAEGDALIARGALETRIATESSIKVVVTSMRRSSFVGAGGFTHHPETNITSAKDPGRNSWNPFMREDNVLLGLYSLPQSLGGDQTLTHTWEELNIIKSGSSRFNVITEDMIVRPGSLVFVENGAGHYFDRLSSTIDIMILWEQ